MRGFLFGLSLGFLGGIAITFVGFQFIFVEPPLPANSYGRFLGALAPTWLDDGRKMKLNADFEFVDPWKRAWLAPAGSVVDGASIPQAVWSLIGGPFEGKYRIASVVHDVACDEKKEPSEDVHRMFYYACRCAGVREALAKGMYFTVLNRGPQWKVVQETKMLDGQQIIVGSPVDQVEGKPMTVQDARAIVEYFETHNPDLSEIATLQLDNGKVTTAPPE